MDSSETRRAGAGMTAGLDLSGLADHLGFQLRLAQQRVFDEFHRRFGAEGLTPARYSVLAVLEANPDARQVAVAEALGIKPPNLAVLIHKMEADGLVERRQDAANRRANMLRLTPAGAALLGRVARAVRAMDRGFAGELRPEEYALLVSALRRLQHS